MLRIDRLRLVLPPGDAGGAARLGRALAEALARELAARPASTAGADRRLERLDGIRVDAGAGDGRATIARRAAAAVVGRLREEG